MHRLLGALAVLAVLGGALSGCAGVPAADTVTAAVPEADIVVRAVRPGVWLHTSTVTFPDGTRVPSNGVAVADGAGLLLVDTAWGELLTLALLDRLEAATGRPVRRAVVTHFHHDRLAGADLLEARGIEVVTHPQTPGLDARTGGALPDRVLDELAKVGGAVSLGPVEVFYPGPGHSEDNLVVWVPEARVLFGGCAVRAAASRSVGNTASADLAAWPDAVRRVQARYPTAEVVVPGHGDAGGPGLLAHTLRLFAPDDAPAPPERP